MEMTQGYNSNPALHVMVWNTIRSVQTPEEGLSPSRQQAGRATICHTLGLTFSLTSSVGYARLHLEA